VRGERVRPIVIAAGGTGGHFFPAEALAAELLARGHRVALMTDARSGGLKSPVFNGLERFVIRGAGIAGRGVLRAAAAVVALAAGTLQARTILSRLEPSVVVGFGGYPCVAPVLATRLMRHRPAVVLHEQNAVLGRANRMLCRRSAVTLATSFEGTTLIAAGVRQVVTGNPVRRALAALSGLGYAPPDGAIRLLVVGGSLGARVLSDVVPDALCRLPAELRTRLHVTQQCRTEDIDRVRAIYDGTGITADLAAFFPDMAALLSAAHLVIARAGASTVAELTVAGRPSVLVPLPGAIDDHQSANAAALAKAGGAWLMPQPGFTAANLSALLETILPDAAVLVHAAQAAAGHGHTDAAARLADLVEATANRVGTPHLATGDAS
jgi:UDP-N-acetylglucosamine--N-acetylmuramyl-(pentapeptide) pyrophosphoryl-undecaprenol N-acetylglucosamine transferase